MLLYSKQILNFCLTLILLKTPPMGSSALSAPLCRLAFSIVAKLPKWLKAI